MIQAPDMKVMADAQWSILQILNSEKMFIFSSLGCGGVSRGGQNGSLAAQVAIS